LSENFRPDVVRGLINRQGTYKTGEFSGATQNPLSKWHHYVRDEEEYFIEISPTGSLKAWSPNGTQHTVNLENNPENYLATPNPASDIVTCTIGDYTFLINKKVYVGESTEKSPQLANKAIVYVQFKDYSQTTIISIDSTVVSSHTSKDGGAASQSGSVVPKTVAAKLYDGLLGGSGDTSTEGIWSGTNISGDFNLALDDNCVYISRKDGGSFSIQVDDSVDGSNAVAIFKEIEQTTLLPNRAPIDFKVKVNPPGGNTTENASFWLQATTTSNESGNTLTWNEVIAPNIKLGMDLSTMPYVLVRESISGGVATFTLRQGEWQNRDVGDDRTNPLPSFVGDQIKSIGIMQNRLYFTAGEAVIMTRSGNFFNFFRETAQASLDTDPIDIYADSEQINYLEASAGFDGDFVFFSETAQFLLPGDKQLTSANAVLRKTTEFETITSVKPAVSGDSIFFAFNYGRFIGIREYFTDSLTDTKRARPITDHVNEYIEGQPTIMVTSSNINLLLIKAEADNVLYTYDWLWQGTDKAQSAWGKLVFSDDVKIYHLSFTTDKLRIILSRNGGYVQCETIDVGDANSEGLPFPVRADSMSVATFTWDETGEVWRTPDILPDEGVDNIKIVRSTDCYEYELGALVNFERDGDELISYDDLSDQSTCTVIIGIKYTCKYIPTNPVAKDQNNQALNLDKMIVGAFYVNYNTSGEITSQVIDNYGNVREVEHSNRTLGGPENIVGFAPLVEGQHRIPIRKRSDQYTLQLITDSHVPLQVSDFSFNGNLNRRGRRI
jgi:hypothetical protein